TYLNLDRTRVSNAGLAHFKECKSLESLHLAHTTVGNAGLAYLKECKGLTRLFLDNTTVTDLSPLQGMPLKELQCDFKPERDGKILRSIKTLETINGQPAAEFWKGSAAREQVEAFKARMKELNPGFDGEVTAPIEGGVITGLVLANKRVADLTP